MTLAILILAGSLAAAYLIIKGIDLFCNRKIKRVEIEHLGAGAEPDRRKTIIEYNGNKTAI
jgi:hypothetical protein